MFSLRDSLWPLGPESFNILVFFAAFAFVDLLVLFGFICIALCFIDCNSFRAVAQQLHNELSHNTFQQFLIDDSIDSQTFNSAVNLTSRVSSVEGEG